MSNFSVLSNVGRLPDNCGDVPNGVFTGVPGNSGKRSDNLPERNVTRPKTQKERWAWLVSDAQRILRSPLSHREEEVAWARDVIAMEEARTQ